MATTYRPADEAQDLAEPMIERDHPHLAEADIVWVFTSGPQSKATVCGALLRYALSGSRQRVELGPDFLIQISDDDWSGRGARGRAQLVDALLCECGQESNQANQEPKWVRNQPLKVFPKNLERHGLRTADHRQLGEVIRDLPEQLRLELSADDRPAEAGEESETSDDDDDWNAPSRVGEPPDAAAIGQLRRGVEAATRG